MFSLNKFPKIIGLLLRLVLTFTAEKSSSHNTTNFVFIVSLITAFIITWKHDKLGDSHVKDYNALLHSPVHFWNFSTSLAKSVGVMHYHTLETRVPLTYQLMSIHDILSIGGISRQFHQLETCSEVLDHAWSERYTSILLGLVFSYQNLIHRICIYQKIYILNPNP